MKIFQLPLNDIQIIDILKRQELTLPEVNKSKFVWDPFRSGQVAHELPERPSGDANGPMHCGRPLFSELRWRRRKMNIKRRRKYLKKIHYQLQTRLQNKAKRYQNLLNMISDINEKKTQVFNPSKFIDREIEKAKFFGYRCSPVYDEYRKIVNEKMPSFDERYFRKFDDHRQLLHIKLEEKLFGKKN